MLTSLRLIQSYCLECPWQLPNPGLSPSQLPCTQLTATCVRHRQLRVDRATAELLTPMAVPVSPWGHSILLTDRNKSFRDILDPSHPYCPQQVQLTLPSRRGSDLPTSHGPHSYHPVPWRVTAAVSQPVACFCPCSPAVVLNTAGRVIPPAKTLSEVVSLPGSNPSIGLPSPSEEQSPAEARRAGDSQALCAPALRPLWPGSAGPRAHTAGPQLSQGLRTGRPLLPEPPPQTAAGRAPSGHYLHVTFTGSPPVTLAVTPPSNPCAIPFCLCPERFLSLLRHRDRCRSSLTRA